MEPPETPDSPKRYARQSSFEVIVVSIIAGGTLLAAIFIGLSINDYYNATITTLSPTSTRCTPSGS